MGGLLFGEERGRSHRHVTIIVTLRRRPHENIILKYHEMFLLDSGNFARQYEIRLLENFMLKAVYQI